MCYTADNSSKGLARQIDRRAGAATCREIKPLGPVVNRQRQAEHVALPNTHVASVLCTQVAKPEAQLCCGGWLHYFTLSPDCHASAVTRIKLVRQYKNSFLGSPRS